MDRLAGIALLIPVDQDHPRGCGYLHYVGARDDGTHFISHIPVSPHDDNHIGEKSWPYFIEGEVLVLTTGIRDQDNRWNVNSGARVRFVTYNIDSFPILRYHNSAAELVKRLNKTFFQ